MLKLSFLQLTYFYNCKRLFYLINASILILNISYLSIRKNHINVIEIKINKRQNNYNDLKEQTDEPFLRWIQSKNLIETKLFNFSFKSQNELNVGKQLRINESDLRLNTKNGYVVPHLEINSLVSCKRIFEGNKEEIDKAKLIMQQIPKVPIYEETYLEWTKNCTKFKKERGYIEFPLSEAERNYPLAFSISTFTDVEQTERLLRAIYHPQNLYCIHIDTKSSFLFHKTVRSIVKCFDNVWVATSLHKIKWGDASVLMSEISCLRDLLKYFRGRYKYFINLTGQEFPIRSNLELVKIANIFNGSNDISGSNLKMDMDRVNYIWGHRWSKTYQQTILYNTQKKKKPYHYANLTFFKGEVHGLFSRKMTEYIVESQHGRMFLEWCMDTGHASEHYWNTLNYDSIFQAPGGYEGDHAIADQYSDHPIVRAKNWVNQNSNQWPCNGKVVRGICIFGLDDVMWLVNRPEMFINKFHLTYEYLGYDCLEEIHRNKTRAGFNSVFNGDYYKNLPTVKYSRKNGM